MVANILTGCVSSGFETAKALDTDLTDSKAPATLRVGDKVRVTVFGEDKLTGEYEIDGAGLVSLPLSGPDQAAGLTRTELQAELTDRLKRGYLRDPKVTVDLVSARPFYILGEVEKPGEYPYRSGLDIWRAMALAGGQTYRASTSEVAIQRAGYPEWRDYRLTSNILIDPGDVIRVPERWF